MEKYVSVAMTPGITFDTSEFADVDLFYFTIELKESKRFCADVTVGGSIVNHDIVPICKGKVYFGCCDKKTYCISLDGGLVWSFETGDVLVRPPAINEDMAYFGSYDENLYAVDADTGKLAWKFHADGRAVEPVIAGGRLYFCTLKGTLFCLNLRGEEIWKYKTNDLLFSTPVIRNGAVYFGNEDGCLHAVSAETGKLLWKFPTGGWIRSMPAAFHNEKLYFGSIDKNLYAVRTDGTLAWKFRMGDVAGVPVVNEGIVYCGSRDANFYAIDAESGRMIWKVPMPNFVSGQACITDDAIYVGCWDCNLYKLNHKGGTVWKFPTKGYLNAGPSAHGDRLYFGCWDCNFYCIGKDGRLLWKFPMSITAQSRLLVEGPGTAKTIQTVWRTEAESEKGRYKPGEGDIADYGTFSGQYIDTTKSDYISHKKKGYKSG